MFLVVGGLTPLGAVVGATVLTFVPQVITSLEKWAPALYGVIVLLMAVYMPSGLLPKNRVTGWMRRGRPVCRRWLRRAAWIWRTLGRARVCRRSTRIGSCTSGIRP